jgi:hypothetical protein
MTVIARSPKFIADCELKPSDIQVLPFAVWRAIGELRF